jgi:Terminase RNaseH-like domain/Terminase large subunit, T4likevirus-type, N-terminal
MKPIDKKQITTYLGNPSLKACGVKVNFTSDQLSEYVKCSTDPIYFIENYVKIVSLDKGAILAKLFPYQKRIIEAIHKNRRVVSKLFRQSGKSTVIACYIAWYITFNDLKRVAILANKASISREIFSRVQFTYENLPLWLQQGVKEWNKTSLELENGSQCFCAASSPSAIRGKSINFLLCDEFAHLPQNLADEFISSVFPTLSSSEESKLVLVSTPRGFNTFSKIWKEAEQGINGFVPVTGTWEENPFRTQKWADEQLAILGEVKYNQEILCSFVGSSYSLVKGEKLASLHTMQPIETRDKMNFYVAPTKHHAYAIAVDTSRGQHLDYSAMVVFDITELPYKVVATFKDNQISPETYPYLIYTIAKQYNNAHVLIEVNDLGEMVSSNLFYEFEYENVYFTYRDELNEGRGYPGVRTTKKVKSIGCSTLKSLIEGDQLEINAHEIIQELGVFTQKGASYAADDENINDDLTTCLWLFAWLTKQALFADLTNVNIRSILAQRTEAHIEETMMPFGLMDDGSDEYENGSVFLDINKYGGTKDPLTKWMFS